MRNPQLWFARAALLFSLYALLSWGDELVGSRTNTVVCMCLITVALFVLFSRED